MNHVLGDCPDPLQVFKFNRETENAFTGTNIINGVVTATFTIICQEDYVLFVNKGQSQDFQRAPSDKLDYFCPAVGSETRTWNKSIENEGFPECKFWGRLSQSLN